MNESIDNALIELWGKVGFIVQLSQMLEYNLANILSANEVLQEFKERDSMCIIEYNEFAKKSNKLYRTLSTKSFGIILKQVEKCHLFDAGELELLREACKKRNYVIHHLKNKKINLASHRSTRCPLRN